MAVLLTGEGAHTPVIPLFEVVGKLGAGSPEQIGGGVVNVGIILEFIMTLSVVTAAHCPAVGVKV